MPLACEMPSLSSHPVLMAKLSGRVNGVRMIEY